MIISTSDDAHADACHSPALAARTSMHIPARPATYEDACHLAPRLREEDLRVFGAVGARHPLLAIRGTIASSRKAWAGLLPNGSPFCIGGAAPTHVPGLAVAWLLATPDAASVSLPFLRACKEWVDGLARYYPHLRSITDDGDAARLRTLRWLGFTFIGRAQDDLSGAKFSVFQRSR